MPIEGRIAVAAKESARISFSHFTILYKRMRTLHLHKVVGYITSKRRILPAPSVIGTMVGWEVKFDVQKHRQSH